MVFTIQKKDSSTRARVGIIETPHGNVETPAYVVVGTHAKVRTLTPEDLAKTRTQLIIANTYHLWRTLDDEGLNTYQGVHTALGWQDPMMTDSGGFQVFSMGSAREFGAGKLGSFRWQGYEEGADQSTVTINEEGVAFRDETGDHYLDAETSIWIQQQLGADIIIAFDEPTSPRHGYDYTKQSLVRTHAWAARCLKAKTTDQLLLGVVQGGHFQDLREESARVIGAMPFEGYAIGGSFGSSFGSKKSHTFEELDWVIPHLPENKPRHLLGIGRIDDIFEAVARGVDTMDCVIPTREARHAALWTSEGRLNIKGARYKDDRTPIDPTCLCPTCAEGKITRADIRMLFKEKNPEAGRLATMHNIFFFNNLMAQIRKAIKNGTFDDLRKQFTSAA